MNQELSKTEAKIQHLELNQDQFEQVECPVKHTFAPGICIREVFVPAGSNVVGHHHNFEHTNIIVTGHLFLQNALGEWDEIRAPCMFVAGPGRKIIRVIDDTVWLNIFPTIEQDVETVENYFMDKTPAWKEGAKKVYNERLITHDKLVNFDDKYIDEYGKIEPCLLPNGTAYKMQIAESPIHGAGLFATADIEKGERIAPIMINGKCTIAGRIPNHLEDSNAEIVDNWLVAKCRIKGRVGGLKGDEITITYPQRVLS